MRKSDLIELRKHVVAPKPWERVGPAVALSGLGIALVRLNYPIFGAFDTVVAGWIVVAGAVVALSIATLSVMRQHTMRWRYKISDYLRARLEESFERINCTTDDVSAACAVGTETVGDVCPTFANVLPRFEKNPQIVHCFRRLRGTQSRMCGYFIVYPLTKSADAAVQSGMIRSGPMIKAEHITKTFRNCSALYIAMIFGIDRSSRALVLFELKEFIRRAAELNGRIHRVYGNPTTLDGSRLLHQYGFVPVSDETTILVAQLR